jgi:hypothetical protein
MKFESAEGAGTAIRNRERRAQSEDLIRLVVKTSRAI